MAKQDLKKVADDFFKRYKKQNKVFITSDGQPFVNEVHATNHARTNDLDVETFRRGDETENVEASYEKSSKALVADINAATTAEAVQAILDTEKAYEIPRKTVTDAAEKKIEKLKTQQ